MTRQENITDVNELLDIYLESPAFRTDIVLLATCAHQQIKKYGYPYTTMKAFLQWTMRRYPSEINEAFRDKIYTLVYALYTIYTPGNKKVKKRLLNIVTQGHKLNL